MEYLNFATKDMGQDYLLSHNDLSNKGNKRNAKVKALNIKRLNTHLANSNRV